MTTTTNPGKGETSGQDYNVVASGCDVNFQNLFMVFAGAARTCVADQLANDLVTARTTDPFIVVSGTELIVFADDDVKEIPFRAGVTGFNELTSISHIGPALGYYAELKLRGVEITDDVTKFISVMEGVQAVNAAAPTPDYSSGTSANPNDTYWLNTLNVTDHPIFCHNAGKTQSFISKACDQTLAYLKNYDPNDPEYDMSYVSLYKNFFNNVCPKATNGIPFNDVMIATFCLVNADTGLALRNNPDIASIDWANSNIIITGQSGGISSGLNTGTNSTYASLHAIALDKGIDIESKTLFAPYIMPSVDSVVKATYADDDAKKAALQGMLDTYKTRYFNIVARTDVAEKMFDPNKYSTLPQVYPSWETDEISVDVLMNRLKTVMIDPRQLLSNSTSSACSQMIVEAGWDASKVVIPGL